MLFDETLIELLDIGIALKIVLCQFKMVCDEEKVAFLNSY